MASNRPDPVMPTAYTTTIAIYLSDYEKFEKTFWNKKQVDFFVKNKRVKGKEVIFEIRSLRVNEFVDILDGANIHWRDIT